MSNVALDVFIGLVFIYLLYSMLVSILAEMIANWFGLRARTLRLGITRMLCDSKETDQRMGIVRDWLLYEPDTFKESMAGQFYEHPNIKYLAKSQSKVVHASTIKTKPAYLHNDTFSHTIINMLRTKGQGIHDWAKVQFAVQNNVWNFDPETHEQLCALLQDSEDDMEAFIQRLEIWFDEMMERVNGWYKRKISLIMFLLGLLIAIGFNVDSIYIAKELSKNDEARDQLVELAIAKVESDSADAIDKDDLDKAYQSILAEVDSVNQVLGLGLPWNVSRDSKPHDWPISVLGWFITALALTLGAPFWFDLLKKLVAIRSAGHPPHQKEKMGERTQPKSPENKNQRGKNGTVASTADLALYQYKNKWEALPGVVAVNKTSGDTIEITHLQDYALDAIESPLKIRMGNKKREVKIDKVVGTYADAMVAPEIWNPANNRNNIEDKGTITGVVRDLYTGRRALITCGHVLSSTGNSKVKVNEAKLSTSLNDSLTLRRIAWTNYADCGFALFDTDAAADKYDDIPPLISLNAISKGTKVKIHNRRTAQPLEAEILQVDLDYTFDYRKKFQYKSRNLITVGIPSANQKFGTASAPGDSGSLVTTEEDGIEKSVGILVGGIGDAQEGKTFIMPMQRVLDTLQLQII